MGAQTITIGYHTNQVLPEPDIFIHTSGGTRIPAHSTILASVSPVWENIIDQPYKHRSSERVIQIHGVPCNAVTAFVTFHYSSMCGEKEMEEYGMHLLTLAHVYMVPQLKQKCIKGLTQRLTVENVVDLFQLARLCDAPDLRLNCMKLLTNHFKAVEKTEGWKFLNQNDPSLELQILRFMDEHQTRKEKSRRQRKEQGLYVELGEAMECLEHICTEGCTDVGPCHVEIRKEKMKPCTKFSTCQGLQLLIRHFATCKRRINGRCLRCKRMWQLFKLHSYICQQTDSCKVPLCRDQHGIFNFGVHEPRNMPNMCTSVIDPSLKAMTDDVYYIVWERKSIAKEIQFKMQQEKREDEPRWKVLAKKVASAKVISSLTLPKRKRD